MHMHMHMHITQLRIAAHPCHRAVTGTASGPQIQGSD
jgi:hypothetical protein